MKFTLNIRHRPSMDESIDGRFAHFEDVARSLSSPWGLEDRAFVLPPLGTGVCRIASLGRKLGAGMKGDVTFRLRVEPYLRDHASIDDFVVIDFDTRKTTWAQLALEAFPGYVRAMGAYIGHIYRWDDALTQGRLSAAISKATGKDLDGRDGFFCFGPISYMDRELCSRGCNGLTPEQIVARLTGIVPDVKLFEDGVLIVAADDFPEQPEINATDRVIRSRLGLPVWASE
jgi:hypothetical protein